MQPVRIPKLADNIALVRNVCLFRAQSPRASAGRRSRNASVVAHVWADERSGSLGTLCGRPPACYQARAFEYCAMRAHGTAMLARATSFDAVAVGGAYPPAGAVSPTRRASRRTRSACRARSRWAPGIPRCRCRRPLAAARALTSLRARARAI